MTLDITRVATVLAGKEIMQASSASSHLVSSAALMASIVIALFAPGVAATSVDAAQTEAAKQAPGTFQLYAVTTQEQFLNHADDRARGFGNNPFGNFKAPTATTKEHNNGPFPGDQALFAFKVYTSAKHTKSAGSAVYTCFYNFNHHGFCDAAYELNGGTLLGSGPVDFNAQTFAIVITGGTGTYSGVTGVVESKSQRYSETLLTIRLKS